MNPKVESIRVKVNETITVELTPEQARSLFSELKSILGENTYIGLPIQTVPVPVPYPYRDYSRPLWDYPFCTVSPFPTITC